MLVITLPELDWREERQFGSRTGQCRVAILTAPSLNKPTQQHNQPPPRRQQQSADFESLKFIC